MTSWRPLRFPFTCDLRSKYERKNRRVWTFGGLILSFAKTSPEINLIHFQMLYLVAQQTEASFSKQNISQERAILVGQ